MTKFPIYWFALFLSCLHALAGDARQHERMVLWGAVTNECRAGIAMQDSFAVGDEVAKLTILYFGTTNVSRSIEAYSPSKFEVFRATIRDAEGREIAKTKHGKKFGGVPPHLAKIAERPLGGPERWQVHLASATRRDQIAFFNILEHFELKKAGDYELNVEIRLYKNIGNGQLQLFKLPPAIAKFHIGQDL